MTSKEWCEHIVSDETWVEGWCFNQSIGINRHWKMCPICGTPRPSEEDELVEELANKLYRVDGVGEGMEFATNLAKAAIEFLKEKWQLDKLNANVELAKEIIDKKLGEKLVEKWKVK